MLAVYAVFIAFILSFSFSSRRPSIDAVAVEFAFERLVLQSNRRHCIPSVLSSCKVIWFSCHCYFVVVIWGVVLLRRSGTLSVCRPSSATMAVDFALGCLLLHWVVRLFGSLDVIALLWRSGALSMCHLPLATVVVEFALGRLVLLSNRRSYIRFASLSCKVIRFFCCYCFVAAFRRFIRVNVS